MFSDRNNSGFVFSKSRNNAPGAKMLLLAGLLALTACGGGGGDDEDPPPKIAGIWSGTWEGVDHAFGPASGTWEAEISQKDTDVRGPMIFGGDIDCAEGRMTGTADGDTEEVSGKVHRDPCPFNDWIFTAFNQKKLIASGTWEKQGLSNGSFEGKRVAKFTGPRIKYIYPPGGRARGFITIVGERLSMDPINDTIRLGAGGPVLVPTTVSDTVITLELPGNVIESDHLVLSNSSGSAMSPKFFNTAVTSPDTDSSQDIALNSPNLQPRGIAFSANGRRAFVANKMEGSVSMINADRGEEWVSTVLLPAASPPNPVYSVVAGPAGRNVYAVGRNVIGVLHAHTMKLLHTLEGQPVGEDDRPNPQGVAVSPDGRWLLASNPIDGGSVTILDVDNRYAEADTVTIPAGSLPRGLATSPDNTRAFIAVSGTLNEVWVYDFDSASVTSKIAIGRSPASVAITPDGGRMYVTNDPANTVNYYNFDHGTSKEIDLGVGIKPHSIGISPDGFKVFLSSASRDIYLIDVLSDAFWPIDVGGATAGIAVSPDGKRAYTTLPGANKIVEIGNQRTLRISKQGGGIGVVKTDLDEIQCGSNCIATFNAGDRVRLTHIADSGSRSRFDGWGGDADCGDGIVTMSSSIFCVANFGVRPPPRKSSGGGGSGSRNCFIATAAYGTWLDPHVLTLREFRDQHLLTNAAGTRFVEFYYRHSPPIADYISERESLRATVRAVLAVIIFTIEYPAATGSMLLAITLLSGWRRRARARALASGT